MFLLNGNVIIKHFITLAQQAKVRFYSQINGATF